MNEKIKSLMKNEKAVKAIVFGGFALIILLFLSDIFSGSTQPKVSVETDFGEYERQIEHKLHTAISAINGVNPEVLTVVVTLDSLCETVYAERGSGVKTVITPRVRGVAIICEGGENIVVKQKIVELVSRLLGISSTRISVTN
jgi:stage III sporulation protein AG